MTDASADQDGLPPSWSKAEIAKAWGISPRAIDRLIADGTVGYYRAGRTKRFFSEHVAQIRDALEHKPTAVVHPDDMPGLSPRSQAAQRRRRHGS